MNWKFWALLIGGTGVVFAGLKLPKEEMIWEQAKTMHEKGWTFTDLATRMGKPVSEVKAKLRKE